MRTTYAGMDIHKNFMQAAVLDAEGNIIKEQKFKAMEKKSNDLFREECRNFRSKS